MSVHDTQTPESREDALQTAVDAVREGRLIVLPTDTVYGIGADAFSADAVDALLEAKGRGRDTPPPVLVGDPSVLLALAVDVPEYAERLAEEFWPGPLTLILTAQPSLTWDLGETRGTVALRMPDDEVALELLRRTGPLAVSSANRHGRPAALSVLDAATQLGDSVEVYLDGGTARIGTSSTIIDTTVEPPEIVREGALSREQIVEVLGDIFTAPEPQPTQDDATADVDDSDTEGATGPVENSSDDSDTDIRTQPDQDDSDPAVPIAGTTDPADPAAAADAIALPSEPDMEDISSGEQPATESAAGNETPLDTSAGEDTADGERTESAPG